MELEKSLIEMRGDFERLERRIKELCMNFDNMNDKQKSRVFEIIDCALCDKLKKSPLMKDVAQIIVKNCDLSKRYETPQSILRILLERGILPYKDWESITNHIKENYCEYVQEYYSYPTISRRPLYT